MLARLTSQLSRATSLAGCLMPRCLPTSQKGLFACYSTRHPEKKRVSPPVWYSLEPELDELLVPRRMSITPIESMLASHYSPPKPLVSIVQEPEDYLKAYDCPTSLDADHTGGETRHRDVVQCKNILKIRRRKMNRHKYKKLQKRTKYLRRKVIHRRSVKKQKKFEKDLARILRRAGLRKAPEGWSAPNVFVKN